MNKHLHAAHTCEPTSYFRHAPLLIAGAFLALNTVGCEWVLGLEDTEVGWQGTETDGGPDGQAGTGGSGGSVGGSGGSVGGSGGSGGGSGGSGGSGDATAPSCKGMTGKECQEISCCDSKLVPGGYFLMGRSDNGTDKCPTGATCSKNEQPEHLATVSPFRMDTYEVTVGRFRRFVDQYDTWTKPSNGDGAHTSSPGLGWKADWNSNLPDNASQFRSRLACDSDSHVWTDAPSNHETAAINCVNWYEAFVFCIWDGGHLPTELEWEYAAAGGAKNRLYPWGSAAPDHSMTNYGSTAQGAFIGVGKFPEGKGRWGHQDLAGGMQEWVFDTYGETFYETVKDDCVDCANVGPSIGRVYRGGAWNSPRSYLRSAYRGAIDPTVHGSIFGFRCARNP